MSQDGGGGEEEEEEEEKEEEEVKISIFGMLKDEVKADCCCNQNWIKLINLFYVCLLHLRLDAYFKIICIRQYWNTSLESSLCSGSWLH